MAKKSNVPEGKAAIPRLSKNLMAKAEKLLHEAKHEEPEQPEFKPMTFAKIRPKVIRALVKLLKDDAELFAMNANERTITHRLARYLEDEFPDYQVDCEYNRKGFNDPKWLDGYPGRTSTRDSKGSTAFPDIIIHLRGVDLANLLVIEVKKSTNPEKDELDQWKLNTFVVSNDYKYGVGLFVVITTGLDILREDAIVARGYWLGKDVPDAGEEVVLASRKYRLPRPILESLVYRGLQHEDMFE